MTWRARLSGAIRSRLRIDTLVWMALVGFIGYRIAPQVAAAFGVASSNQAAPALDVTLLDGSTLSARQLRGKVVLVNFWATWCPPCRLEMPGFQAVYDRRRNEGFVVLGLSTDATGPATVEQYLTEHGITYPVAMATGEQVRNFGGASLLPTSFLIDRQGRIRHEVRGIFASLALEQAVNRLLNEPAVPSAADHGTVQGTTQ